MQLFPCPFSLFCWCWCLLMWNCGLMLYQMALPPLPGVFNLCTSSEFCNLCPIRILEPCCTFCLSALVLFCSVPQSAFLFYVQCRVDFIFLCTQHKVMGKSLDVSCFACDFFFVIHKSLGFINHSFHSFIKMHLIFLLWYRPCARGYLMEKADTK